MATNRARVTCRTCGLDETFDRLADARYRIEEHRAETGHDADWVLGAFPPGVERAGDLAGVCGLGYPTDETPFSPEAARDEPSGRE